MSDTSFDKFAVYYDKVMGDSGDYTHQNTFDPAIFKAAGTLKGKTIYDIGCGNGYLARKMKKKGAKQIWGSDISPNLINTARNKYSTKKIKYFVCEGNDFKDIPNNYFDIILMNMVIHFIDNLDKLFSGIYKALGNGGVFAFTTNHPYKPLYHFSEKKGIDNFEEVVRKSKAYLNIRKDTVYNHWSKKNDLIVYHRPLGYYIEKLYEYGLVTKQLVEPETKAQLSYETMEKVNTKIPSILAVSCIKTEKK